MPAHALLQSLVLVLTYLVGIVVILRVRDALTTSRSSGQQSIDANLFNESLPQLRGRRTADARTYVPKCPTGYVDQTEGAAYWWECGKDCPGPWPWSDFNCDCACVLPEVYHVILAERANAAAAAELASHSSGSASAAYAPVTGANAPAAGTFIASPWEAAPPTAESQVTTIPTPSPMAPSQIASPSPTADRQGGASQAPPPSSTSEPAASSTRESDVSASASGSSSVPVREAPVSLGPATRARVSAPQAASASASPILTQQKLQTTIAPSTSSESDGLSGVEIALISIGSTVLLMCVTFTLVVYLKARSSLDLPPEKQTFVVRVMLRFISQPEPHSGSSSTTQRRKKFKQSRVHPSPDEEVANVASEPCSNVPYAVQLTHLPAHGYLEQHVQPEAQARIHQFACPDVSILSRKYKEKVMTGGWTNGLNPPQPGATNGLRPPRPSSSSRSSPRPSNGSGCSPRPSNSSRRSRSCSPRPSHKAATPSIRSDTSTRSPSLPPSIASTGSKAPTPPSSGRR